MFQWEKTVGKGRGWRLASRTGGERPALRMMAKGPKMGVDVENPGTVVSEQERAEPHVG